MGPGCPPRDDLARGVEPPDVEGLGRFGMRGPGLEGQRRIGQPQRRDVHPEPDIVGARRVARSGRHRADAAGPLADPARVGVLFEPRIGDVRPPRQPDVFERFSAVQHRVVHHHATRSHQDDNTKQTGNHQAIPPAEDNDAREQSCRRLSPRPRRASTFWIFERPIACPGRRKRLVLCRIAFRT